MPERIELDAASVDGVICRFGYMLMASPSTALSETRRVLRPGGRLVLAVWGAPDRNPWVTALAKTLVEHGHVPPPEPAAPSPFALADDKTIRALLEGAGFASVRTEQVQLSFAFRDLDDYVSYSAGTAGPAALVLGKLSDDDLEPLKTRLEEAFAPFATDEGYELPAVAVTTVAR